MSMLRPRRPSPALVVSIIALVIASAGTATAASVLIKSSKQVAKGAINSSDLANRKAVNVADLTPAARAALTAKIGPAGANGLPGATGPVGPKGDKGAPGTPVAAPEAFKEVGTAGSPAFESGWTNFGPGLYDTAAFYKDPLGVVHLKGTVKDGVIGPIFTLPAGYRPAKSQFFAIPAENAFGVVLVRGLSEGVQAGKVHFNAGSTDFASLDGITFRAAP